MSGDQEAELASAIAGDEIVPWFQPLVALRTRKLIGFEVLARWHHPTRGIVHPSDFIPLAEQTGLIAQLTERLLSASCRAAAKWPDQPKLSVNLSPVELNDRALPDRLRLAMADCGLSFDRLIFEVTEAVLIGDVDLASTITRELKALGAGLALDDFGKGYANLCQLRALPFDRVKIDSSFVRAMATQPSQRQIVAAMIGLAHTLGLCTVAEGVETQADADMLTSLGCDVGQGWLFGRPVPADQVPGVLGRLGRTTAKQAPLAQIAADIAHRLEALPGQCMQQLRALYIDAPVGFGLLDQKLNYVALNRRLADMHGAPVADHIGRTVADMVSPALYEQLEPHLRRVLGGEPVTDFESRWQPVGADEEHVLLASYQPVRDAALDVTGISVAVLDFTEREQARRARSVVRDGTGGLTARQTEVLRLIAAGYSAKEVARALGMGVGTVKTHLTSAYRRLGVRNRVEAIRAASEAMED